MAFKARKKEDKDETETTVTYQSVISEKPKASSGSFIGRTMDINADIDSDENLTIVGKVKGNINVGSTLIIGRSGSVNADIKAAVVRIYGTVKGNIFASDKVEIHSYGRHTGNIKSQKLVVEEGAVLNGYVNEDEKR